MIVVNARFLTQNITGVQRYGIEIGLRLKKMRDDIVFVSPHNIVNTETANELEAKVIGTHTGHLWEQVDLPRWLRKNGSPLLVCFANTAPAFYGNKIVTLHDITFKRYPKTFSWKFRMVYNLLIPQVLRTSRHVVTVSEFSKSEISEYYGYPRERMSVVYSSMDDIFVKKEDESLRKENYFFAVSSIKESKNFFFALKAFIEASKKMKDVKFFIAGDLKNNSFHSIDISEYKSNPNIKFLGRISDDDLIRYYSNAIAFIFPSLYEGFGLPPLEGQSCGCPAICSDRCSLPEVYGDSVLYCNPHDVNSLAVCMEKICDEDIRTDLAEKGYANTKRYGFDRSAKSFVKIIQNQLEKQDN